MTQKALRSPNANQRAFLAFYHMHAPRLRGCILLANLPTQQAEVVLISTLNRAWTQLELPALWAKNQLAQLLTIAQQQGLPSQSLETILPHLRIAVHQPVDQLPVQAP